MIGPRSCARVDATYYESRIASYKDHPLILALGEMPERGSLFDILKRKPAYTPEVRLWSWEDRIQSLPDILGFVFPTEETERLFTRLSIMARHSLKDRNPLDGGHQQRLRALSQLSAKLQKTSVLNAPRNNPLSGLITGMSGLGKSTLMEVFMDSFPGGVIMHDSFRGEPINCQQIPFIYILCDAKGSLNGLFLSILKELQRLSGFDLFKELPRGTGTSLHALIPYVVSQLIEFSVSMVVIDEAEFVTAQFSGGSDAMLFNWIAMMNTAGVSLVLIANPEIEELFARWLKAGMRFSAGCRAKMLPLPPGEALDELTEAIWHYQYTKTETPLVGNPQEQELRDTLYRCSQGNIRQLLTVVYNTQELAMTRGGDELITPQLILEAAQLNGPEVQVAMEKWANGDQKELDLTFRDLGQLPRRRARSTSTPKTPKTPAPAPALSLPAPRQNQPAPATPEIRRGTVKPTGYLSYLDVRVRGDYSIRALMEEDGIIGDGLDFWTA